MDVWQAEWLLGGFGLEKGIMRRVSPKKGAVDRSETPERFPYPMLVWPGVHGYHG